MQIHTGATRSSRDSSIVDRVLAAVAKEERCGTLDLPPLYDVVDPDALERVLQGTGVNEVSFSYHGYSISIVRNGRISVTSEEE